MPELFGIEFAPLFIPFERRIQTLAVICFTLTFSVLPLFCCLLNILLLFTPLFWIALGYITWILYDVNIKKTSSRGGRRIEYLRRGRFWNYFRDYFPMSLIKTADLDPDKNYILGYHPHGIVGCGCVGNFASEATGFSEKFKGITPYVMTLKPNFNLPLIRGFLLYHGVVDVSKESIQWILTKQGTGNAAVIVVGGAEEALRARPGIYNILLAKRKGFVKQAIRAGASLVPIYSFGENDLYQQVDNPSGSWVRRFQEKFKETLGFSPPLFYGRGIFNYSFGMLPFRTPITTIVGRPIDVEKEAEPSQDTIDKYHKLYMEELARIFDEHKIDQGINKDTKLNFV